MSAHPNPTNHVVLKGSRRSHRPGAQVLGRSDPHEWCEITVKLRRQAALPEPVAGKAVLTRTEAAEKYGASPADCQFASNHDPLFAVNRDPSEARGFGLSM
jgi:hypothetical protein